MFSESEKPLIATDTLPWPPRHLRPYIEQDYTQDWEIVDESIPDDLRKEFEEWHKTVFLEAVKWGNERYKRRYKWLFEQVRYDKIRDERLDALWKHKPFKVMKNGYIHHHEVGIIQPECEIEDMTLEELREYVDILNEGRKNWLEEVKRQENTPGYLPEDFDEKNLDFIRITCSFDKNLTFHEIIDVLNKEVLEINEYLKKKESDGTKNMSFFKNLFLSKEEVLKNLLANLEEIKKHSNEINSRRNKLDAVEMANIGKIITELRLRYEKSIDIDAKETVQALCVDYRLEGPYEEPVNDAFLYLRTRATAPLLLRKSLIEAMPKIIMESNLFEYSSDNVKKAVILALENYLIESKRINKENIISYYNTFEPALPLIEEKPTGSLAAAVNLYENIHDKRLISYVFPVFPGNTDFNWEYSYVFMRNNIHNISKNDILVIAENFNEIVNFPHTKCNEELIAEINNLLQNEKEIIRGEKRH